MKLTDVYFTWQDGKETIESFANPDDVFGYIEEMRSDGHEVEDFKSDNIHWLF